MSAPPDIQPYIEVDPDVVGANDDDSVADTSRQVLCPVIGRDIFEYRSVRGRTYQSSKTTEYWSVYLSRAPNDEKHIESFDVAHQWMTMMQDDKLYTAPIIDNPHRILDIGTGTGIWAIDMADQFPSATIFGTDISPTQPPWVPPNLTFQIDDAQLDWTFEPNSFDFIHIRFMYGAIDDWPKLYRQVYRCLKPGGWFQHMEPDIAARCSNPKAVEGNKIWKQWTQLFYDAGDKLGRTFRLSDIEMEKSACDAGFADITHRVFNIPYGTWPKDKMLKQQGQYAGLYLDLSLDGFALLPIGEVLGWSFEEVEVLVAKMRAVVRNPNNWVNSDMHIVYGRKPDDAAKQTE
ncbi:hypothetical protein FDECE_12567 [Fusarium decemcellulare]|nr:hypothetical protein FDECE_12567 [Fusarium decemcellulare]